LPLADVKSTVEAQLRQDLARKMAQTEGEAKLKALQAKPSDTVDGLAAAKDVSKVKPDSLSAAALVAIVRASGQALPAWAGATLNNGQYAVYKVLALGAAPVLDDAKKQAAQGALKRAYAEQETQSIVAVLRDRHNVKLLKKPSAADANKPAHSGS
jgi:hypothetical protein